MSQETTQDVFFESLYKDNFDKLKMTAFSKLRNLPVAEELAQETFLIALRNYEKLRQHEEPRAYLNTVLQYKISEYLRARKRYLALCIALERRLQSDPKALSNDPLISTSAIVETVQDTLTEKEWYLLRRFSIDGASHRQIAAELDITVGTSQKRLERIRKKLEDVLPREET